jgi:hypothetical protein
MSQDRPSFLERLGRKVLIVAVVMALVVLLFPAVAGGAVGAALIGAGSIILKSSWLSV